MDAGDRRYIRHAVSLALGAILAMPSNDDGKSEIVERLKRALEKIDAADMPVK